MRAAVVAQLFALAICLSGRAQADDLSLAELSSAPARIKLYDVILSATSSPYFNGMPRVRESGKRELTTCETHGNFFVSVDVLPETDDEDFRKSIKAEHIWVVHHEHVSSVHVKEAAGRLLTGSRIVRFGGRGCGTPAMFPSRQLADNADDDDATKPKVYVRRGPKVYVVIQIRVGKQTHLIRAAEAEVGLVL
jgi:hypothetical protein